MCSLSSKFVKETYPYLAVIRSYTTGELFNKCPICFSVFSSLTEHMRKCESLKLNQRKFLVLTLDGINYMCPLGCNVEAFSAS